jgi:hypothetical protein
MPLGMQGVAAPAESPAFNRRARLICYQTLTDWRVHRN